VIAREEIASALTPGSHGSTFGGNALVCRAASAVVDRVKDLLPHVREAGSYFKTRLEELRIGEVRGMGLMIGLDLGRDCRETVLKALERGLVINCTAGTVLRFLVDILGDII